MVYNCKENGKIIQRNFHTLEKRFKKIKTDLADVKNLLDDIDERWGISGELKFWDKCIWCGKVAIGENGKGLYGYYDYKISSKLRTTYDMPGGIFCGFDCLIEWMKRRARKEGKTNELAV